MRGSSPAPRGPGLGGAGQRRAGAAFGGGGRGGVWPAPGGRRGGGGGSWVLGRGCAEAFGTIAELQAAIGAIPASTRLIRVERAGHDLKSGRFDLAAVVAAVREAISRPA